MGRQAVRQAIRALIGAAVVAIGVADARAAIEIDLVTFGVGDRIFEKFGHAALCARDGADHRCYNFGVTDFDEGAPMVWRFVRGNQPFWVERQSWDATFAFYSGEDRDIWVQTLPLTDAQAVELARLLDAALGPQGHYDYDHFFQNCTTQLRDLIDRASGGQLAIDSERPFPHTFRDLGRRGLAELPALVALADFVLGRQLEDTPTVWQAMFHPEVLRAHVFERFGAVPQHIYARRGEPFPTQGPTGRVPVVAAALAAALPVALSRARRRRVVFAIVVAAQLAATIVLTAWVGALIAAPFVAVAAFAALAPPRWTERLGLVWATLHPALWGLAIWALVIVSAIPSVRWNEVVLVVAPFDVALPWLSPRWRVRYARWRAIQVVGASIACALGVLRQPLWVPILVVLVPMLVIAVSEPSDAPDRSARPPGTR